MSVVLAVVLTVAVSVYAYWVRSKNVQQLNTQYAHLTVGEVARRLGLTIHSGDPNLNLLMAYAEHLARRGFQSRGFLASEAQKETAIEMSGRPRGRAVEFVYRQRVEVDGGLSTVETTRTLDFHLSTAVLGPFPDFEIFLRSPAPGAKAKAKLGHPDQSFGDAELDRALVLRTADPSLGPLLRDVVRPLAKQAYLHLVGEGGYISYLASFNTSSTACVYLLEVAEVQEGLACALEARTPERVASAPRPTRAGEVQSVSARRLV